MALSVFNGQLEVATSSTILSTDSHQDEQWDSFITDFALDVIQVVILIVLCGVISLGGLVANVINIIVFFRQGALSSSSNLSLLALAFADIGSLLPVFMTSVTYATYRIEPNGIFMSPRDFWEVSGLWPHVVFVQISSCITAYIAFERCICVLFPFKVKTLFSAKRSLVIIVIIAVVYILSYIPTFASQRIEKITDHATNMTKLAFAPTESFLQVIRYSDYIHGFFFRSLSLLVVFVCTQITVYYVKLSKSWRKSMTTADADHTKPNKTEKEITSDVICKSEISYPENKRHKTISNSDKGDDQTAVSKTTTKTTTASHSNKERRLIRMITLISVIFLVCNTPDFISVSVLYFAPMFKNLDQLLSPFRALLLWTLFMMESINASINIVVYYRMSSRYKQELRAWLRLDHEITK